MTSTSVSLVWTAVTSPASCTVSYKVYRYGTLMASPSLNHVQINGLAASTTHRFTVVSVDAAGASAHSAELVIKTEPPPCTAAPSVPTGLKLTGQTCNSATLAWTAATAGSGCSVAYDLYQNGSRILTVPTTTAVVSGLASASSYTFSVASVDKAGASIRSAPITLKTKPAAQALMAEAKRELAIMTSSTYQHDTVIDEAKGVFDFDCSGFVDYALRVTVPASYGALPHPDSFRPSVEDIEGFIHAIPVNTVSRGWMHIAKAADLRPGDILAWLKPPGSISTSTGHVMIVAAIPVASVGSPNRLEVVVIDSVSSGHANDTRLEGESGLGKGTICLVLDSNGRPVQYCWKDFRYPQGVTAISLGRLVD